MEPSKPSNRARRFKRLGAMRGGLAKPQVQQSVHQAVTRGLRPELMAASRRPLVPPHQGIRGQQRPVLFGGKGGPYLKLPLRQQWQRAHHHIGGRGDPLRQVPIVAVFQPILTDPKERPSLSKMREGFAGPVDGTLKRLL